MADTTLREGDRRPVVGIIGSSPPVEVIVAAGARPELVRPDPLGPTSGADPYLDTHIDPGVRNVLHQAVTGALEHMDLLVVDGSDDRLFHFMKEVVRLGEGDRIPPLYCYELLQSGEPADGPYNLMELRALVDRLRALTGAPVTDADLAEAVAASNRARAMARELMAARQGEAPRISGAEAAEVMRRTRGRDPAEAFALLSEAVARLPNEGLPGARLMLIPAAELHDDAVHRLFEDAGAVVTVEDDLSGARAAAPDFATGGDPLAAIAERNNDDIPGPQMHPAERRFAWTFRQMAAPHVEAIVFYIPPGDRDFGWSFPRLRDACERLGKPWLLIREDAYDAKALPALKGRAADFVSRLRQGAAA